MAKPASEPSGRLIGSFEYGCCAFEHAEHTVHLCIAARITGGAFDENRRRHSNGTGMLHDQRSQTRAR